jgi:mobilome CxxCx(11)CxxC protein
MAIADEQRRLCNDNALHCHGTAYIFERRASSIRWKLRVLSFLGIAVPAAVGAILGTFSLKPEYVKVVGTVAGVLSVTQLVFSIWSLVSHWDTGLSYYLESKSANYRLAADWSQLGNTTIMTDQEFATRLQVLEKESEIRSDLDNRHDISDTEKRTGMRAGLRKYQRPCVQCGNVPKSMKGTDCGVCGK